jgi:hypothetical protein
LTTLKFLADFRLPPDSSSAGSRLQLDVEADGMTGVTVMWWKFSDDGATVGCS